MCKIIVMANQKGGVAKTSSTRNLAYSLAEMGQRVLAVDFDPQTNLTISFGIAPATVKESTASLMMKMLMDEALPDKDSYILNIGRVDLIPSKKALTVAEVNMLIERQDDCLDKLLSPLRCDYDYILVDTGPSLGSLAVDNDYLARDKNGQLRNWGQLTAAKWMKAYTEKGYACAVHVPHLNDFNTDLVEMRKGRSVEDLDRQRMAELETAFEQSAEEEPEQGMEV